MVAAANSRNMSLIQGYEPLVLADGSVISPDDGAIVKEKEPEVLVEVPNNEELQREVVAARTRIADLPAPAGQMNTISIIIGYSLYGVTNEDIATILSMPLEQVEAVKMSDTYTDVQSTFIDNIVQSDKSNVRDMFVEQSKSAARKMAVLMDSNSEAIQLAATKDILDRAGQRPVDVVEHRHKVEGGLTIEYVTQDNTIPTIDITPNAQ